jgi:hypothetical protein
MMKNAIQTLNTKNHEFFTRLHKKTFTFPEDNNLKESNLYDSEFYPNTLNGKHSAKIEGKQLLEELQI